MITNYFKIAFRNLLKNKIFSFINIFGLAVGITVFSLIVLYIQYELSYDKFHRDYENIYLVEYEGDFNGRVRGGVTSSALLAPNVEKDVPEIESATRLMPKFSGSDVIRYGENKYYESGFWFADKNFFQVFDFQLIDGDASSVFDAPFNVVITSAMAEKYFGKENPLGKQIEYFDGRDKFLFTVSGVMQNIPENSHLQFDFLASFKTLDNEHWKDYYGVDFWYSLNFLTYVKLKNNADPVPVDDKMSQLLARYTGNEELAAKIKIFPKLRRLDDIYLYSDYQKSFGVGGNLTTIIIFLTIAVFLLLIACINFMNLTTARFLKRAKEVSVRKTIGANRKQLIFQFLSESVLIAFISTVISVVFFSYAQPYFNELMDTHISLGDIPVSELLLFSTSLVLIVGVFAGIYPSVLLSSFESTAALSKKFISSGKGVLIRKVLVGTQFFISSALITGSLFVGNQLAFMKEKGMGFDKENIITVPVNDLTTRQQIPAMITELKRSPEIVSVSAASSVLGYQSGSTIFTPLDQPDKEQKINILVVDYDFVKTMNIEFKDGRNFSRNIPSDETYAFIVNKAAAAVMDGEAIGKEIHTGWGNRDGRIIGVVDDFNFQSLHSSVEPLAMMINQNILRHLFVKVKGSDTEKVIAQLRSVWEKFSASTPFEYKFLDEELDRLYKSEEKFGSIIDGFTWLIILIACLGLFGLATYQTQQKRKEIAVRKVFGSSAVKIVNLLVSNYVKLIVTAYIVSVPVIIYGMREWLSGFAYKIDIGLQPFVVAALLMIGLSLCTVLLQALKAALSNPIDSLRDE